MSLIEIKYCLQYLIPMSEIHEICFCPSLEPVDNMPFPPPPALWCGIVGADNVDPVVLVAHHTLVHVDYVVGVRDLEAGQSDGDKDGVNCSSR